MCRKFCDRFETRGNTSVGTTPFLPMDLIFDILIWVPAETLYDVMRFVCREWYELIQEPTFIHAHLQRSRKTILIQHFYRSKPDCFLAAEEQNIKLKLYKYRLPGHLCSSCNGLVLGQMEKRQIFYIANPITRQQLVLPRVPLYITIEKCSSALGYAPSAGKYKVVCAYIPCYGPEHHYKCAILTMGIDKTWRPLDIAHLTRSENIHFFTRSTITTEGFIHWGTNDYDDWNDYIDTILTLDLETEIFKKISVPKGYEKRYKCFFANGGSRTSLSFLTPRAGFLAELWVLTEIETEKWVKLAVLNCETLVMRSENWELNVTIGRVVNRFGYLLSYDEATDDGYNEPFLGRGYEDVLEYLDSDFFWVQHHTNSLISLTSFY